MKEQMEQDRMDREALLMGDSAYQRSKAKEAAAAEKREAAIVEMLRAERRKEKEKRILRTVCGVGLAVLAGEALVALAVWEQVAAWIAWGGCGICLCAAVHVIERYIWERRSL